MLDRVNVSYRRASRRTVEYDERKRSVAYEYRMQSYTIVSNPVVYGRIILSQVSRENVTVIGERNSKNRIVHVRIQLSESSNWTPYSENEASSILLPLIPYLALNSTSQFRLIELLFNLRVGFTAFISDDYECDIILAAAVNQENARPSAPPPSFSPIHYRRQSSFYLDIVLLNNNHHPPSISRRPIR